MKELTVRIYEDGEYSYPAAFGFVPKLHGYLHEDDRRRPCMLVIPGGAYLGVSPTEGEIVAKKFYSAGFQVFVGTYTTNPLMLEPVKLQAAQDISRMIRLIRSRKEAFHIEEGKFYSCGFSAGGHAVGTEGIHAEDLTDVNPLYKEVSNIPTAMILCYPVITMGEYRHPETREALLGQDPSEEELAYMSLETQVTDKIPPVFLWQTVTDDGVPVENSMLLASALRKANVPFAMHLFSKGQHGLSLADETWASGQFGEPYTLEQMRLSAEAVKKDLVDLTKATTQYLPAEHKDGEEQPFWGSVVPEVTIWPELVCSWIEEL